MRTLIVLLLGGITVGTLFYGLRLLWYVFFPAAQTSATPPEVWPVWLTSQVGKWLLAFVILLIMLLVMYDMVTTEDPGEHRPPPPVTSPSSQKKPIQIK
ncbi:MAG: hypothetical protein H7839_14030 [Magnetococcus sp. YQC-5]